jgi:hypothetical protein
MNLNPGLAVAPFRFAHPEQLALRVGVFGMVESKLYYFTGSVLIAGQPVCSELDTPASHPN